MRQNKIIAITGGIGSGKSTVAKILRDKGYSVYSCDEIYAELTRDKEFLEKLNGQFGDILNADGWLNRKKLSQIVFADAEKLKLLNSITHPAIYDRILTLSSGRDDVCFFEVPLLFEDGKENMFDEVIVVLRDKEKRIEEVMRRDELSEEEVISRINNQFNYENYNFAKYYVIHNDYDLNYLRSQIDKLLLKLT